MALLFEGNPSKSPATCLNQILKPSNSGNPQKHTKSIGGEWVSRSRPVKKRPQATRNKFSTTGSTPAVVEVENIQKFRKPLKILWKKKTLKLSTESFFLKKSSQKTSIWHPNAVLSVNIPCLFRSSKFMSRFPPSHLGLQKKRGNLFRGEKNDFPNLHHETFPLPTWQSSYGKGPSLAGRQAPPELRNSRGDKNPAVSWG